MARSTLALALALGPAVALLGALPSCSHDPPPDTASNVDLNRFQGQWYEIAHLPRPTQTDCAGTIANYTLTGPTTLTLAHQCNVGGLNGPLRQNAANAVVKDPSAPAKLSVDFGGFYGDYWILDVDADYRYAVVGHPSRAYLWILSRTPTMEPSTYGDVTARAQRNGFDISQLQLTPQTEASPDAGAAPSTNGATPASYGCSSAATGARPCGGAAPASFLALLFALRRRRRSRDRIARG